MKTLEILDKIIAFFSQPDSGYGHEKAGGLCLYYLDDTHKCAVGCLLQQGKALTEYIEQSLLPGSYDHLYEELTGLLKEADVPNEYLPAVEEFMSLSPTDLPDTWTRDEFFTAVQNLHDTCARADLPKEQFVAAIKNLRMDMEHDIRPTETH